ncbi:MAG TPA: hypothetical protein VKY74_19070 [Chloroflexia bacterium]|nr:hypothetical protein [Chloroflexia bacterium]
MHYNSVDQFLTVHTADLARLMQEAMAASGGFYATLDPAALAARATQESGAVAQALRTAHLDRTMVQAAMRTDGEQGLAPADSQRKADQFDARLLAFLATHLGDQPDLYRDLLQRLKYIGASYRSNVRTVELDAVLARLTPRTTPS